MRSRQIFAYLILAVAVGFGITKIASSGLLEHMEDDLGTFLGVFLLLFLLGAAIVRVLRS